MIVFETERLSVRQLEADDVDNLYSVTSDPELTHYMGDGQPLSYELTAKWVDVSINNYATKGYGCSAVIDKRDGAFIGFCGLVRSQFAEPPADAELIYALKKSYWGQGLATEVAGAMVAYGYKSCGLKRIIATIDPENSASIKVANKIGFVFSRNEPDSDGLPIHIYEFAGKKMQAWKTLDKKTVLQNGKWITVEYRTLELPNGKIVDDWTWIILPEYVNVVAVTELGRFLCFEQVKYAVEGVTLAPVGGYLEPGEVALEAAQRELLEETGYSAPEWIALGNYAVDGNRGAGVAHLFLAKGAVKTQEINADDLEEQELVLLDRPEVESALKAGAFKVLAWSANVALALLHLG